MLRLSVNFLVNTALLLEIMKKLLLRGFLVSLCGPQKLNIVSIIMLAQSICVIISCQMRNEKRFAAQFFNFPNDNIKWVMTCPKINTNSQFSWLIKSHSVKLLIMKPYWAFLSRICCAHCHDDDDDEHINSSWE